MKELLINMSFIDWEDMKKNIIEKIEKQVLFLYIYNLMDFKI